jgi:hypothetical protein
MITITGSVKNVFGANASVTSVSFRLCGYSSVPVVSGTGVVVDTAPDPVTVSAGSFSASLYGNDVIAESGTYYAVQFLDSYGNALGTTAYQFTGSGTQDISTLTPYNPTTTSPLSGFVEPFYYSGNGMLANTAHPIIAYGTGGSYGIVLTLPVASLSLMAPITIKKTDSADGIVYVQTQGTDTIDGASNYQLDSRYKYITVLGGQNGWSVIANN